MILLLLEMALLGLAGFGGWWGARVATDGALAAAVLRGAEGDEIAVRAAGIAAGDWFLATAVILAMARLATSRRRGAHIAVPFLFPAALAAMALGLTVQLAYGSPFRSDWPGPQFAVGTTVAAAVAAVILLVPVDLPELLRRFRLVLAAGVGLVFAALVLFGDAPGASDQRINLGPVQPIEAIKVGAALLLAVELGSRAAKLRYQRARIGGFRVPRPRLLIPAIAALVATLLGLFLLRDFGPTLILGGLFLLLFYVVTRSVGQIVVAVASLGGMLAVFAWHPEWSLSTTVETRLRMWLDPWLNGLPNGDQLALARWALAAGGVTGTGAGASFPGALPAGHTDLIYAHLVEEMGFAGGCMWLALLGVVVASGLYIGARNRTPERVVTAVSLSGLLALQAAVILAGTLGILPLTGVVVPFLSYGKSGMAAFLGVVALMARLAEDGAPRAETEELRELRGGVRGVGLGLAGLASVFVAATGVQAVLFADATSLRGVVTTLGDGTPSLQHDPRLQAVADAIRRGSILDRNGQPLAVSPAPGTRVTPLGTALGTVLGPAEGDLLRAKWSVERMRDTQLRGYPEAADGPALWLGRIDGREVVVLAVPSAANEAPTEAGRAAAALARRGGVGNVRRVALVAPDFSTLLPLARLPLAARAPAVALLSEDVASRSFTTSLDARLQAAVARQVVLAAKKSKVGAAAVVVSDPATGQILARAQWPDYDPGGDSWRAARIAADPEFMGIYGAWSDKTGAHGVWQAGSVFKVVSAFAAARSGLVVAASEGTCPDSAEPRFDCNTVIDGKTAYNRPDWTRPIHDFGDGGGKGRLDLVGALTRSSNVYFGQLALALGPEPYRKLREEGVEFGNPGLLAETDGPFTGIGARDSRRLAQTGFGQGAGSWNVTQAARFLGALANGGRYLRCPADMELAAECAAIELLPGGGGLDAILAGMRGVMESGTGSPLAKIPGIRVYGKTGTADAPGTADEAPWGIKRGATTAPHSWFVAIAEPESVEPCAGSPRRYVVTAVVPHGGFGAKAAGPLAMAAIAALGETGYFPRPPP